MMLTRVSELICFKKSLVIYLLYDVFDKHGQSRIIR